MPPRLIVLKGKPISTQHAYKIARFGSRSGIILTDEARALKEDYGWQAKSQWKHEPLTGDLLVEIRIYFPTKQVRDWDNWHKLSMDALNGIVWEDDHFINEVHVSKRYDPKNPRIEISVAEL
ncbi:MAG: RusA family crossover junction endodeoxyribonuclease [Hyphomicrobiaceae bacterium]